MFKSKTVFVVGAGASCEAGLPSGEDLKKSIAGVLDIRFDEWGSDLISGDRRIVDALREAARDAGDNRANINPYLHKAWRIRDVVPAAAISIDNFLDAHRGDEILELCGKLGIVKSILDAERGSKLKGNRHVGDTFSLSSLAGSWYLSFLNMLTENVIKSDIASVFDNVTIVTFNYDRCIEHFLVQALSDYYEITIQEAEAIVSKLPIYHPYGAVGALPWQDRQNYTAFGSERGNLLSMARQIKTFTEGMDDDQMLTEMHNAIIDAETIVFLGFAFHPINMKLLTPPVESGVKRVFATTLGLSEADKTVIADDVWKMLGKGHFTYAEKIGSEPEFADLKCGDFFKYYFRSMSAQAD